MLAEDHDALAAATGALLAWYDEAGRDLPWRRTDDPWAVWVSEVMLQQTRVDAAIDHYRRFVRRFPDPESLAAASEDEVLAAWSGLGYYRRARYLHRATRQVVEAGSLPRTAAEWKLLPGVGDYTAAAIASIAGGEKIAVLDGNVERVLSRMLASAEDPKRAAPRRRLLGLAQRLLSDERPGDSNQAVMELGATICRPVAPRCEICVLRPWCAGSQGGDPERYPPPRRRTASRRVERRVVVVRRDGAILLARRPRDARQLAGFWELPWTESRAEGDASDELEKRYGGRWRIARRLGRVRHSITDRRFEIEAFTAEWSPDGVAESPRLSWVEVERLDRLPTSSLVEKVLRRADSAAGEEPVGR